MIGLIQAPRGALPERAWPRYALRETSLYALACMAIGDTPATVLTIADRRACAS